jgi:DUF2997 family protein
VADKTELEITIGPDGAVHIVTHGLKGQSCLAETKDLEEALGTVKRREKTREFYQAEEKGATKVGNR